MRTRARNVLFIPLLCVFLVAACAPDDPIVESGGESSTTEPLPWAEEALIWHRAMDEMLVEQGGVAWEYFWDPDVKFDYQPMILGAGVYHAAFAFALMYRLLPEGQLAFDQRNVAYVSTSGTLTLGRLDWAPSGMDVGLLEHPADIVNILEPIGLNGAERMLAAFSVDTWRERYDHEEIPSGAEALARQWVEDWTSGELSPSMYRDECSSSTRSTRPFSAASTRSLPGPVPRRAPSGRWTNSGREVSRCIRCWPGDSSSRVSSCW
ncbi:MAG: hypothetical protein R2710_11855 [Acidimicrobiales bacterium]